MYISQRDVLRRLRQYNSQICYVMKNAQFLKANAVSTSFSLENVERFFTKDAKLVLT